MQYQSYLYKLNSRIVSPLYSIYVVVCSQWKSRPSPDQESVFSPPNFIASDILYTSGLFAQADTTTPSCHSSDLSD